MKKLGLILCVIALTFSCSSKKEKGRSNVVNLAITAPVRSLDPRVSNEYPSVHVINMLFEGLMRLGPNGEVIPGAAQSVDISEDQCTYLFHLRDSKWSNGDPVTAYDFEYAWKKSVDPTTARNGAFTFYTVKNVEACLQKKVSVEEVGIHALDAKTLEVTLEHPAPYFLSLCTCSTYSPIHKEFDLENPNWGNSMDPGFVGNGPFILKRWKKDFEICLEKNPNYWEADIVNLSGIHLQVVPDINTQYCMFEKKELDWVGLPFNVLPVDVLIGNKEIVGFECIDAYGLFWLFMNTEKPPFNNKNFRKALAYALNRKDIAEHVFQLGEEPAMGILSKGLHVQEGPYFEDGNIPLAKEYLSKALEEMNLKAEDLKTIVLSQRSCLFTARVLQVVQEQLRKGLNLNVQIEQSDWPVHFNRLTKGDYEFGEVTWTSWLRDPIYMLDTFRNRNLAINMSRWEHPRYQELLSLSDYETDPEKRKEYLRQAEEFLMEEMPVIPVCFSKLYYLRNPHLKGVYASPLKEIDFRYAYFDEGQAE
ncbi:MAG: peptide ABC transporter substrate-binding protein [Chlamydiia bacterium]|nr:peptide ABC transporter substrate-binding protein [Chlamydiia bacterium]